MTHRLRNLYLVGIVLLTAALWAGAARVGLNSDDLQYIPTLAPIAHLGDIFRPFLTPDANPSYFRPVANMTMSLDFLLFGWSGAAFHLTNLLFHLLATVVVFYFVRDVFRTTATEALLTSLAFGLVASHDYNLLVDTARADVLATLFVMLTVLWYGRWRNILSLLCFGCALLSKEIAVLILPFLPVQWWSHETKQRLRSRLLPLTPYVAVFIAFYLYHAHFTTPILASQPLTSSGAHSALAFLRNGVYSLGYFLLPLDLAQATAVLGNYQSTALLLGIVLVLLFAWFVVSRIDRESLEMLARPMIFSFLTGSILLLSFERWRLYLPSVGFITIIVLSLNRLLSLKARRIALFALVPLLTFHIYRALAEESSWQESTALRDQLWSELTHLLSKIPDRPSRLGFIDSPAKLGSASVILLGENALVRRAEADRISSYNRAYGTERSARVDSWTAVDVYAIDRAQAFRNLTVDSLGVGKYLVSAPASGSIILYPPSQSNIERRELLLHPGDSIAAGPFTDIVRSAESGKATAIEVDMHDPTAVPVTFDSSQHFRIR